MKALHTVKKSLITEKALKMSEQMTYTFYVDRKSTKIDIKTAMKELYSNDVANVRIINLPKKQRAYGRKFVTKRPEMKKALVTFKGKKKIDVTKIAKEKIKK